MVTALKETSPIFFLSSDLLPYSHEGKNTQKFMRRIVDKICDYLEASRDRSSKVVDFQKPDQLSKLVDLEIREKGDTLEQMEMYTDHILHYSVKGG